VESERREGSQVGGKNRSWEEFVKDCKYCCFCWLKKEAKNVVFGFACLCVYKQKKETFVDA
jgi:hypothetical protein